MPLHVELTYHGALADEHSIDLYDVAQALEGFQRSLALTTHLVLNGEIITQATSLKGAEIRALAPEPGSWKVVAAVVAGLHTLTTAPRDTPVGHLVSSAYDYVISESLGFHVDYEKTLGQQYEELKKEKSKIPQLPRSKFDSLIEKCQPAIKDMHRPLVFSESATSATLTSSGVPTERQFDLTLDAFSYEYISFTETKDTPDKFEGLVSSYNINTFKGRIFVPEEERPIPFELGESARTPAAIRAVTRSLSMNAQEQFRGQGRVTFTAFVNTSRSGRIKSLFVFDVKTSD